MPLKRSIAFFMLAMLVACSPAAVTQIPVSQPVPYPTATYTPNPTLPMTSPQPTEEVLQTGTPLPVAPTLGPTVEATTEGTNEPDIEETSVPDWTPIPQQTAQSTSIPLPWGDASAIQMYSPGPMSKVVTPLEIYGYAVPGYKHKGRVDLYGEAGQVIASEILQLNTAYKWAYFYWPLPFEISSVGELGRLSMSTQDQYGRLTAVYSVHLLLLPEGDAILNPPGDLRERCVITQPATGQKLSGGKLTIVGKMFPFNDTPLDIKLIGRDGVVLDEQLVTLPASEEQFKPFRIDIQYTLTASTWELLTVSQMDDRIGGLMYLYSQEILLYP